MVKTYCNFGLYDEDTNHSCEEGDTLSDLTYVNKNGQNITLTDVTIQSIDASQVELVANECDTQLCLDVDDIVTFNY